MTWSAAADAAIPALTSVLPTPVLAPHIMYVGSSRLTVPGTIGGAVSIGLCSWSVILVELKHLQRDWKEHTP